MDGWMDGMPAKRPAQEFQGNVKRHNFKEPRRRPPKTSRRTILRAIFEAVLATTELLENSLRYLPTKDLLLAQRVWKKWRAVITENLELQEMLFLSAERPTCRWKYFNRSGNFSLSKVDSSLPLGKSITNTTIFVCGRVNDLLFRGGNIDLEIEERARCFGDTMRLWKLHDILSANLGAHPEASCHKMFITQPSQQEAKISVDIEFIRTRYLVQRETVNEYKSHVDGIRISELLEVARQVERDYKTRFEYARVVGVSVKTKWMLLPTEEGKREMRILNGVVLPSEAF